MFPRRTIEIRFAVAVIVAAVAFTAVVLVWRLGYDDDPWTLPLLLSLPPVPRMQGLAAFELYLWLWLIARVFVVAAVVGVVVRWVMGWRGATRWIGVVFPPLVCVLAAGIYAPFWGATAKRVDRVAGVVEEPVVALRRLAVSVGITFVLAAVFIVVTRSRRTPESVRQLALVVPAVLAGILLNLLILIMMLPASDKWMPASWREKERLVPFRACRGAMLWLQPDPGDSWVRPFGRIDDVWERFADLRSPGRDIWAVSVVGEWREEYLWLSRAEAVRLRMRSDDPAVARCDSRTRLERVAPASWHRFGLD